MNKLLRSYKEKFWRFMDSCKGFWTLILALIVAGIGYMIGSKALIDWYMKKRDEK